MNGSNGENTLGQNSPHPSLPPSLSLHPPLSLTFLVSDPSFDVSLWCNSLALNCMLLKGISMVLEFACQLLVF